MRRRSRTRHRLSSGAPASMSSPSKVRFGRAEVQRADLVAGLTAERERLAASALAPEIAACEELISVRACRDADGVTGLGRRVRGREARARLRVGVAGGGARPRARAPVRVDPEVRRRARGRRRTWSGMLPSRRSAARPTTGCSRRRRRRPRARTTCRRSGRRRCTTWTGSCRRGRRRCRRRSP